MLGLLKRKNEINAKSFGGMENVMQVNFTTNYTEHIFLQFVYAALTGFRICRGRFCHTDRSQIL